MAYINGLTEEQRAYAEKEYKFHRRVTSVDRQTIA